MPQDLTIKMGGGYFFQSYSRIVRDLSPLIDLDEPAQVNVDMSTVSFMGPAALATTVAVLMGALDRGLVLSGDFIPPSRLAVARYLERMDFFKVLFHDPDFLMRAGGQRGEPKGLLECQHFVKDADLRPVMVSIIAAIEQSVSVDASALLALDDCLSEMLENVLFHAYTPQGGIAAVQYLKSTEELELAIVDLGIGIQGSLALNEQHANDAKQGDLAAIKMALTPNITSTPDRNSGWGLTFTELLLTANGGRLNVRSGAGNVMRGANTYDKVEEHALPGTVVAMRIKTNRRFDSRAAWDALDLLTGNVVDIDVGT